MIDLYSDFPLELDGTNTSPRQRSGEVHGLVMETLSPEEFYESMVHAVANG